jgi:hypothetical protein
MLSMLPTSLTLRSLIVMIVAFAILKVAPQLGHAAATQIGESIATILGFLGASGVSAGYMRRVYTPATPEIEADAAGFLGKAGWRSARDVIRPGKDAMLAALIERLIERIAREAAAPAKS